MSKIKVDRNKELLRNREDSHSRKFHALYRLRQNIIKQGKKAAENSKTKQRTCTNGERNIYKKRFVGYWLLTTNSYLSDSVFFEFTFDEFDLPILRTYVGTQENLRVPTPDDLLNSNLISGGFPLEVVIVNEWSVIIKYFGDILGIDELTYTFTIQKDDPKVALSLLALDNPHYGTNIGYEYVTYKKLDKKPFIQQVNGPAAHDWNNPVNLFNYINDYFFLQGNPQKAKIFNQQDFIGKEASKRLFHKFLTTGIRRKAVVTTKRRVGSYIGVWRTQFPEIAPVTTIHTEKLNHFNPGSDIRISGFKGAYSVLNGLHKAAAFPPSTISDSPPMPWELNESREHFVNINYDSSNIGEAYDPKLHGVARLEALHGPITCNMTSYRSFIAAIIDYVVSVFGEATHNRISTYIRMSDFLIPDTFDELAALVANNEAFNFVIRFRTYVENTNMQFYKNPYVLNFGFDFPPAQINDPFQLGILSLDPNFDYDIVIRNYLEENSVHNVFWTVTGPVLPDQPITQLLTDIGYPSNGSEFVFTTNSFLQLPPPLVDNFGEHPYRFYGNVFSDPESDRFAAHNNYCGGIVNRTLTEGKVIAYIRLTDESGFDSPQKVSTAYSLVFGRKDMPNNKLISNEVAALAALLKHLNSYHPEKYIFDFRSNGGGYADVAQAIPYLFGANRPGWYTTSVCASDNGTKPVAALNPKLDDAFGGLLANAKTEAVIDTDLAAKVFPESIVRGTPNRPIELIILNDSNSASAGDMISHIFLGPNPKSTVQNIGANVISKSVGDINGKLYGGLKQYDAVPYDPEDPMLETQNNPVSPVYMAIEASIETIDRHGTLYNLQPWIIPHVILPRWYDTTIWQDLGLVAPRLPYRVNKPNPTYNARETWRDVWLEYAINTPKGNNPIKC